MSNWQLDLLKYANVHDGHFGKNTEWPLKDFARYVNKLVKLGAENIKIIDAETFSFTFIPPGKDKLLICILTESYMPSFVKVKKDTSGIHTMTLEFRY